MAIPSIIRTFGSYFQQKRKRKFEAKKRKQEKKALEKQRRKAQESLSPNSIAINAKITSKGHDIDILKSNTSTNKETINGKKKKKTKEKIRKEYSHTSRSAHLIYTPMGNKR